MQLGGLRGVVCARVVCSLGAKVEQGRLPWFERAQPRRGGIVVAEDRGWPGMWGCAVKGICRCTKEEGMAWYCVCGLG